ncbi:hypothetical protein NK553_00170 [Pseudomonas sp. ZM23]|uniref:Lipoprotein n=1 Tax=Pseudomonas triclosanedens TaxID=2961893 RepID=A0ABY6ZX44_9PSED|nr:hypothetical protein [Pseudomonas triclosanedens]MCP8462352.1 hypothetical protein [Pseudomonas triclosanedens]MCP8467990.1 hypothetical protein [Pseudomonas triclosanedens]MCP8474749.1 hypothetical protein [Pseudomonas triclosanedens]WAI49549.1 hypothetical protein OU419_28130 [Pseudomonas triclosanedens]
MKRTLPLMSALLLAATLQGCGDDSKPAKAEAPVAADSASASLPSGDSCSGHELEKALPPAKAVYGYPFISRECGYNDATITYGKADGSQRLVVTLTDTGMPAPGSDPQSETAKQYLAAQAKLRDTTSKNVALLNQARQAALQNGTAAQFGGEEYLPVIDSTRMGDPLAISVPGPDDKAGESTLTGLIKGRYVLNMSSPDKPNKGTAQSLRELFVPISEQMALTKLP